MNAELFESKDNYTEDRWNIKLHVSFWLLFYVYLFWEGDYPVDSFDVAALDSFIYLLTNMAMVYVNLIWLVPNYLYKSKFLNYALFLLIVIALGGATKTIAYTLLIPSGDEARYSYWFIFSNWFFKSIFETISISSLQIIQDWSRTQNQYQQLENKRLEAELKYLKLQMQPHFLFNTLNNIYFLINKDKEKASESVLKLSELLRYRLYEVENKNVGINSEISNIKNYLELQKLRYDNLLTINFTVKGQSTMAVEPYVFMDFIENSFKHSAATENNSGKIDIIFDLSEEEIIFTVTNTKQKKIAKNENTSGIGLSNIMQRLNLVYPDKYKLTISENKDTFSVNIKIKN